MKTLGDIFERNRTWAAERCAEDPEFFARLKAQQRPEIVWIGCSDSRVPANQICGLAPGEVFVHRNVANLVVHSDFNCLSVLEYGVHVLGVRHVIVCGHYGCGGVQAALQENRLGLIDNWLRHVRDVRQRHAEELDVLPHERRVDRLCELNVRAQVANVCHTTIVQRAWEAGRAVTVHGWIYRIEEGLLQDLGCAVSGPDEIPAAYRLAFPPAG